MKSYIVLFGPRSATGNTTRLLMGLDDNSIVSVEKVSGMRTGCANFKVSAKEIRETIRMASYHGVYNDRT